MGEFIPRDALIIGVILIILSFVYGFLSMYLVPPIRYDSIEPFIPYIPTNMGFSTSSSILIIMSLFFCILSAIYQYYYTRENI